VFESEDYFTYQILSKPIGHKKREQTMVTQAPSNGHMSIKHALHAHGPHGCCGHAH
jgi:hypothetical protein